MKRKEFIQYQCIGVKKASTSVMDKSLYIYVCFFSTYNQSRKGALQTVFPIWNVFNQEFYMKYFA